MTAHPIEESLARAAEREGDLAARVYARLFADHPETVALFRRDADDAVKGEMLARSFEAILDLIDGDAYASHMVACEAVTHEGYGVPPQTFRAFFAVIAAAVREALGEEWCARYAAAWADLIRKLEAAAAPSDAPPFSKPG